jgi:hypothetical protein
LSEKAGVRTEKNIREKSIPLSFRVFRSSKNLAPLKKKFGGF